MITFIDMQLSIWGKWAVAQAQRSVGYPPVSPMFRDVKHGGAYGSAPPCGVCEQVSDTDEAVKRLPPELRALAVEVYQVGGKSVEVARRLGIARQRLYERLDLLHREMLGHLNDIAAGC